MKPEQTVRREFIRTGHLAQYEVLRDDNHRRVGLMEALAQLQAGRNHSLIRSGEKALLQSIQFARYRAEDREKFDLVCRVLVQEKAMRLLRSEELLVNLAKLLSQKKGFERDPQSWKRRTKSAESQFVSLVRHLFCRYDVPIFLIQNLLQVRDLETDIELFFAAATGTRIYGHRTMKSAALTRKMVHHFRMAPAFCGYIPAIRWAQVKALGGDKRFFRVICRSFLGAELQNDDFWLSVIRWCIQHGCTDNHRVHQLLRYISYRKFGRFLLGQIEMEFDPPDPDFKITGRSLNAMFRANEAWKAEIALLNNFEQVNWQPAPINGFEWAEKEDKKGVARQYRIRQLVTNEEVVAEGKAMKHCVGSYIEDCRMGATSIWSLRKLAGGTEKRMCTIEVSNRDRRVAQVKQRFNALPNTFQCELIIEWATAAKLEVPEYSLT
ncbi:MAG: PcfJ domain-containing protein [Bacteroidota bacterium]